MCDNLKRHFVNIVKKDYKTRVLCLYNKCKKDNKFCQKKLNYSQKRQLNRALFAESIWHIDRTDLADKALKGAFRDKPIFSGLCEVMCDVAERKLYAGPECVTGYAEYISFRVRSDGPTCWGLQGHIKAKKSPEFDNFPADRLKLWKREIRDDQDDLLSSLSLDDEPELLATKKIFPDSPPEEHIHVIVSPPDTTS
ncbi:hypothetical protein C1645_746053 [Glomus cerebriforme]|uniref:Crinkler effector protein N-terminal domain-containing protein n=1 Tax=Glomus cerebriforme TaxID=658196 RepID=A0A397S4D2_9GLOM|nr:hypothetical protein C1645_746053 [Glomus cerebriforme]